MRSLRKNAWRVLATAACGSAIAATAALGTANAGASGPVGSGLDFGHQAPYGIQGSPGPYPGSGASTAQWQAWAAAQTRAVETTTWAAEVASTGGHLDSVTYVSVADAPDVPAGIVTTAVSLTVTPASGGTIVSATVNAALTVTPDSSGGGCVAITDGAACVEWFSQSGGIDIEGVYEYGSSGSVNGHVELSVNGCPGSLVGNAPNKTLTNGVEQELIYGPVFYTAEWAASYWRNNGGTNYTYFGSDCNYF